MKKILEEDKIIEVSNTIFKDEAICTYSSYQLVHKFLSILLNNKNSEKKIESLFDEFKSTYSLKSNHSKITKANFIGYIIVNFLQLKNLPSEIFNMVTHECIDDIKEINKAISKYTDDKNILDKNKEIEGKNYRVKLLIYYIKKLKRAEEEIIEFLAVNSKKHSVGLSKNTSDDLLMARDYRYHYRDDRMLFAIENLNEITHKIDFVSVPDFFDLFQLYKKNKPEFFITVKEKYPASGFILKITNRIETNHILKERSQILNQLLSFYSDSTLNIFINLVPQQIEGLLYDLALEVGVAKETLKNSSVTDKAEHIKKKMPLFNDYIFEYFHFVFPLIRNRIAHGMKIKEDISNLSYSLLLDLNKLTELICSDKVESNKAVKSLRRYNESPTLNNAILFGEFINTKFDEYYDLAEIRKTVVEHLRNDFKFANVESIVNSNTVMSIMLKKYTEKIRNYGINKPECGIILDQIKKKKGR